MTDKPNLIAMEAVAKRYRTKGWKLTRQPPRPDYASGMMLDDDLHVYSVKSPRIEFSWGPYFRKESDLLKEEAEAYVRSLAEKVWLEGEIAKSLKRGDKQMTLIIPLKHLT